MVGGRTPESTGLIGTKKGDKVMKNTNKIYTHDEAMLIVEEFENVLNEYGIKVPSPEDDERDEESETGLYGSTYSDLLDAVEYMLIEILKRHSNDTEVIEYEFSGNI